MPLKIVGEGRSAAELRRLAGPDVEFLGRLDDAAVADLLGRCRALLLPGREEFGRTAVEAQAAGRPVVALAAGGALATVISEGTGVLFLKPTAAALAAALEDLGRRSWSPERGNAAHFGRARSLAEMAAEVAAALTDRRH